MKLYRPHIPITTRIMVASRQCIRQGKVRAVLEASPEHMPRPVDQLAHLLKALFGDEQCHCDHEPALVLRHRKHNGEYDPPANSIDHLIYRTKEEHRIKTFVRGDGAQLSDAAKRRKEARRKRKGRQRKILPPVLRAP